jgi:hypothetical protein
MQVRSVTFWSKGPSGYEEVVVEYELNWLDKLLHRSAVRRFVYGAQGWRNEQFGIPSRAEMNLIIQVLIEHGRLRPSGAQYD